jgi:hypothetical protein
MEPEKRWREIRRVPATIAVNSSSILHNSCVRVSPSTPPCLCCLVIAGCFASGSPPTPFFPFLIYLFPPSLFSFAMILCITKQQTCKLTIVQFMQPEYMWCLMSLIAMCFTSWITIRTIMPIKFTI